ncbi:MAG: glycosyltransferase family 4 protein [Thermosynechococcaceae cyanobacterium]
MTQNEKEIKKKILFIVGPVTQDSGILRHILELAQELSHKDYDTGLVTRLMGKKLGQLEPSKKYFAQFNDYLEYFYVKSPNLGLGRTFAERLRNIYFIFRSFYELKSVIDDYRPDIIHTHSLSSCFQVNALQYIKIIPHITTLHQDLSKKYEKYHISTPEKNNYKHIINYFYDTISNIGKRSIIKSSFIAISDEMKTQIRDDLGVREEKVNLIYHGVDPTRFKKISTNERIRSRKEFGIHNNAKVACLVGSLIERKGHDILIESLSILRAKNIDVVAVLAGTGDEKWKQKIEGMAINLGVRDLVNFVGFTDTFKVFSAADILVAPSRYEAFPLVSIEAMLSGIVPIRTPTSGSQNQITEGVDGFIVPYEDAEALADTMKLILFDDSLREQMSDNAIKKAQEKFTRDRMVNQTLLAYQGCLNSVKKTTSV